MTFVGAGGERFSSERSSGEKSGIEGGVFQVGCGSTWR